MFNMNIGQRRRRSVDSQSSDDAGVAISPMPNKNNSAEDRATLPWKKITHMQEELDQLHHALAKYERHATQTEQHVDFIHSLISSSTSLLDSTHNYKEFIQTAEEFLKHYLRSTVKLSIVESYQNEMYILSDAHDPICIDELQQQEHRGILGEAISLGLYGGAPSDSRQDKHGRIRLQNANSFAFVIPLETFPLHHTHSVLDIDLRTQAEDGKVVVVVLFDRTEALVGVLQILIHEKWAAWHVLDTITSILSQLILQRRKICRPAMGDFEIRIDTAYSNFDESNRQDILRMDLEDGMGSIVAYGDDCAFKQTDMETMERLRSPIQKLCKDLSLLEENLHRSQSMLVAHHTLWKQFDEDKLDLLYSTTFLRKIIYQYWKQATSTSHMTPLLRLLLRGETQEQFMQAYHDQGYSMPLKEQYRYLQLALTDEIVYSHENDWIILPVDSIEIEATDRDLCYSSNGVRSIVGASIMVVCFEDQDNNFTKLLRSTILPELVIFIRQCIQEQLRRHEIHQLQSTIEHQNSTKHRDILKMEIMKYLQAVCTETSGCGSILEIAQTITSSNSYDKKLSLESKTLFVFEKLEDEAVYRLWTVDRETGEEINGFEGDSMQMERTGGVLLHTVVSQHAQEYTSSHVWMRDPWRRESLSSSDLYFYAIPLLSENSKENIQRCRGVVEFAFTSECDRRNFVKNATSLEAFSQCIAKIIMYHQRSSHKIQALQHSTHEVEVSNREEWERWNAFVKLVVASDIKSRHSSEELFHTALTSLFTSCDYVGVWLVSSEINLNAQFLQKILEEVECTGSSHTLNMSAQRYLPLVLALPLRDIVSDNTNEEPLGLVVLARSDMKNVFTASEHRLAVLAVHIINLIEQSCQKDQEQIKLSTAVDKYKKQNHLQREEISELIRCVEYNRFYQSILSCMSSFQHDLKRIKERTLEQCGQQILRFVRQAKDETMDANSDQKYSDWNLFIIFVPQLDDNSVVVINESDIDQISCVDLEDIDEDDDGIHSYPFHSLPAKLVRCLHLSDTSKTIELLQLGSFSRYRRILLGVSGEIEKEVKDKVRLSIEQFLNYKLQIDERNFCQQETTTELGRISNELAMSKLWEQTYCLGTKLWEEVMNYTKEVDWKLRLISRLKNEFPTVCKDLATFQQLEFVITDRNDPQLHVSNTLKGVLGLSEDHRTSLEVDDNDDCIHQYVAQLGLEDSESYKGYIIARWKWVEKASPFVRASLRWMTEFMSKLLHHPNKISQLKNKVNDQEEQYNLLYNDFQGAHDVLADLRENEELYESIVNFSIGVTDSTKAFNISERTVMESMACIKSLGAVLWVFDTQKLACWTIIDGTCTTQSVEQWREKMDFDQMIALQDHCFPIYNTGLDNFDKESTVQNNERPNLLGILEFHPSNSLKGARGNYVRSCMKMVVSITTKFLYLRATKMSIKNQQDQIEKITIQQKEMTANSNDRMTCLHKTFVHMENFFADLSVDKNIATMDCNILLQSVMRKVNEVIISIADAFETQANVLSTASIVMSSGHCYTSTSDVDFTSNERLFKLIEDQLPALTSGTPVSSSRFIQVNQLPLYLVQQDGNLECDTSVSNILLRQLSNELSEKHAGAQELQADYESASHILYILRTLDADSKEIRQYLSGTIVSRVTTFILVPKAEYAEDTTTLSLSSNIVRRCHYSLQCLFQAKEMSLQLMTNQKQLEMYQQDLGVTQVQERRLNRLLNTVFHSLQRFITNFTSQEADESSFSKVLGLFMSEVRQEECLVKIYYDGIAPASSDQSTDTKAKYLSSFSIDTLEGSSSILLEVYTMTEMDGNAPPAIRFMEFARYLFTWEQYQKLIKNETRQVSAQLSKLSEENRQLEKYGLDMKRHLHQNEVQVSKWKQTALSMMRETRKGLLDYFNFATNSTEIQHTLQKLIDNCKNSTLLTSNLTLLQVKQDGKTSGSIQVWRSTVKEHLTLIESKKVSRGIHQCVLHEQTVRITVNADETHRDTSTSSSGSKSKYAIFFICKDNYDQIEDQSLMSGTMCLLAELDTSLDGDEDRSYGSSGDQLSYLELLSQMTRVSCESKASQIHWSEQYQLANSSRNELEMELKRSKETASAVDDTLQRFKRLHLDLTAKVLQVYSQLPITEAVPTRVLVKVWKLITKIVHDRMNSLLANGNSLSSASVELFGCLSEQQAFFSCNDASEDKLCFYPFSTLMNSAKLQGVWKAFMREKIVEKESSESDEMDSSTIYCFPITTKSSFNGSSSSQEVIAVIKLRVPSTLDTLEKDMTQQLLRCMSYLLQVIIRCAKQKKSIIAGMKNPAQNQELSSIGQVNAEPGQKEDMYANALNKLYPSQPNKRTVSYALNERLDDSDSETETSDAHLVQYQALTDLLEKITTSNNIQEIFAMIQHELPIVYSKSKRATTVRTQLYYSSDFLSYHSIDTFDENTTMQVPRWIEQCTLAESHSNLPCAKKALSISMWKSFDSKLNLMHWIIPVTMLHKNSSHAAAYLCFSAEHLEKRIRTELAFMSIYQVVTSLQNKLSAIHERRLLQQHTQELEARLSKLDSVSTICDDQKDQLKIYSDHHDFMQVLTDQDKMSGVVDVAKRYLEKLLGSNEVHIVLASALSKASYHDDTKASESPVKYESSIRIRAFSPKLTDRKKEVLATIKALLPHRSSLLTDTQKSVLSQTAKLIGASLYHLQAEQIYSRCKNYADQMHDELTCLENTNDTLSGEMETQQQRAEALLEDNRQLEAKNVDLEAELEILREQIRQQEREKAAVEDKLDDKDEEVQHYKLELENWRATGDKVVELREEISRGYEKQQNQKLKIKKLKRQLKEVIEATRMDPSMAWGPPRRSKKVHDYSLRSTRNNADTSISLGTSEKRAPEKAKHSQKIKPDALASELHKLAELEAKAVQSQMNVTKPSEQNAND